MGIARALVQLKNIYKEEYDVVVKKKECVGHVQKRLGMALRKLEKITERVRWKGKVD